MKYRYRLRSPLVLSAVATILALLALGACARDADPVGSLPAPDASAPRLTVFTLGEWPRSSQPLGGFSGLAFEGTDEDGSLRFITHTDRGPNLEPITLDDGTQARPFLDPGFNPEWIRIRANSRQNSFDVVERVRLEGPRGARLTGLPNLPAQDEVPVDSAHRRLPFDPDGLDLEGIAASPDGTYWMVEEYRPSLVHFSARGRELGRYVADSLAARQPNRGFEGVALDGGKVYCFLQSPLRGATKLQAPIVEFDIASGKFTREFLYPFESAGSDKIGDAVALGGGRFLVIEQNSKTGPKGFHRVYEVDLANGPGRPVRKRLVADLTALGFDFAEKIEGLALVDERTIAVVNDNDFEVAGPTPTYLGIIRLARPLR
jgi:hypothetical protein